MKKVLDKRFVSLERLMDRTVAHANNEGKGKRDSSFSNTQDDKATIQNANLVVDTSLSASQNLTTVSTVNSQSQNTDESKIVDQVKSVQDSSLLVEDSSNRMVFNVPDTHDSKQQSSSVESSEQFANTYKKVTSKLDDILKKMWNWILIGSEKQSDHVSIEYAIATTWLLRIGIITIIACVGYFLKWSMNHGVLGPWGRISISIMAGLVMVVWGSILTGKRFHLIGQGFVGGGFATLYFSLFAAGPLYQKLPLFIVFLLMIFITICAIILSLQLNSMLVAIFAATGGFVTPLLLQSSEPNFTVLFVYLTLLNLGVVGIAYFKQWRLLNYFSFYFTYVYLLSSMNQFNASLFFPFMLFSMVTFFSQAILVYLNNFREQVKSTTLEVFHLLLNTCVFSGVAYTLLSTTFGRPYPALLAIGLSVFFIVHILLFINKKIQDGPLIITFLSLAVLFSVWAIPLIFGQETMGIMWSLQALLILWLSLKLKNQFMKGISMLLYIVSALKLFLIDFEKDFVSAQYVTSITEYLPVLVEHLWQYGIVIGSFVAAFYLLEQNPSPFSSVTISEKNDTQQWTSSSNYINLFFWMSSILMLVVLLLQTQQLFSLATLFQGPMLMLIWVVFGLLFIRRWIKTSDSLLFWVGGFFLFIPFVMLLFFEFSSWGAKNFIYLSTHSLPFVCARVTVFLILMLGYLLAKQLISKEFTTNSINTKYLFYTNLIFGGTTIFILWLFLSFEVGTILHLTLPSFKQGGISVLWSIFAMVLLFIGINKDLRNLRYIGLALFTIVVCKVFLVDLSQMDMIVRVFAFFIVGLILILAAAAYIKGNKQFKRSDSDEK